MNQINNRPKARLFLCVWGGGGGGQIDQFWNLLWLRVDYLAITLDLAIFFWGGGGGRGCQMTPLATGLNKTERLSMMLSIWSILQLSIWKWNLLLQSGSTLGIQWFYSNNLSFFVIPGTSYTLIPSSIPTTQTGTMYFRKSNLTCHWYMPKINQSINQSNNQSMNQSVIERDIISVWSVLRRPSW